MKMRTVARFESAAFNTTTPQSTYFRPDNFGDDVARWLADKLRGRRVSVDDKSPEQEDHGWYVSFSYSDADYDAVVVHVPNGVKPGWLITVERGVGLVGSVLGRRHTVPAETLVLIHDILTTSEECEDVRWLFFDDFRRGDLGRGAPDPLSP